LVLQQAGLLPGQLQLVAFVMLAILELSVPLWAERTGHSSWHPHHIAERYGLFAIILLGEACWRIKWRGRCNKIRRPERIPDCCLGGQPRAVVLTVVDVLPTPGG
jgi:hypothetical protein